MPTYSTLERYADLRRQLRRSGGLTLVTTDTDFRRVPSLALIVLPHEHRADGT